jgi:hypothetical protein
MSDPCAQVGALRRVNQADVSTACGAAIGAYNGIIKDFEKEKKEKAFDVRRVRFACCASVCWHAGVA